MHYKLIQFFWLRYIDLRGGIAMSIMVGIDLGTTNSAIAVKTINTEVLTNQEGSSLSPSVVFIKQETKDIWQEDGVIVGQAAKNWQKQAPENTVSSIKRLMGRSINDQPIQKIITEKLTSYKISPLSIGSNNGLAIFLPTTTSDRYMELLPEEISALILKKIIADGQNCLNDKIESAVITVPAYFNDKQKHSTRIAAAKAGIKVPKLLPEPTSAAISFGMDELKGEGAQTILVYDFGGGTLDISVLTIGGENIIEQGKGGDMWLGGNDLDQSLMQLIIRKASEDLETDLSSIINKMSDLEQKKFNLELLQKAETAKIELSRNDETNVTILGLLCDQEGDPLDIDITVQRTEFEKDITAFVDHSVQIMNNILEGINFTTDLIEQVLLVGGSSQIPLVKQKLEDVFGKGKIKLHPRPMQAIAEGAAIMAHKIDEKEDSVISRFGEVVHTSAHDYYIKTADDEYHLLVPKFTPLPFETEFKANLISKDQVLAHFPFYNQVNDQFESIGDLWLSFSSENGNSTPVNGIDLKLKISEDNLIEISAHKSGEKFSNVTKALSRGNVDEQLYLNVEEGLLSVNNENNYYLSSDYESRTVDIITNINNVLDKRNENIDQDLLSKTQRLQKNAQEVIKRDEPIYTNIWHYESLVESFGNFIDVNTAKKFRNEIKKLRNMNSSGEVDVDEMLECRDRLSEESSRIFSQYEDLHHLGSSYSIACEHQLSEAKQMKYYLDQITQNNLDDSLRQQYTHQAFELSLMIDDVVKTKGYQINTGVNLSPNNRR